MRVSHQRSYQSSESDYEVPVSADERQQTASGFETPVSTGTLSPGQVLDTDGVRSPVSDDVGIAQQSQSQQSVSSTPTQQQQDVVVARESLPLVEIALLESAFNQQTTNNKTPVGRPTITLDSLNDASRSLDEQDTANLPLLIRLVSHCVCIAARAGDIIRSVSQQKELGIVEKDVHELQTEADRCAQACIVTSLQRVFPAINIVGEEDDLEIASDPKWIHPHNHIFNVDISIVVWHLSQALQDVR